MKPKRDRTRAAEAQLAFETRRCYGRAAGW